jgi:gephyrin
VKLVEKHLKTKEINHVTVPDDEELIKSSLIYHADVLKVNGIFTTGGTGFTPRDVTPEATKQVITKEAQQLALAMTLESLKKTKFAVLSRYNKDTVKCFIRE